MKLSRLAAKASLALTTAVTFTAIGATAASAGVYVLPDDNDDVLEISDYGLYWGDFEMDLSSLRIDHQTSNLVLTHTVDIVTSDSFETVGVQFDTNRDGWTDHFAVWDYETNASRVFAGNLDSVGPMTCSSFGVNMRMGAPGSLTFTIPRWCLGNPSQVAVHSDLLYTGYDEDGVEYNYAESAPGSLLDDYVAFSPSVAVQRAATVTPGPVVVVPKPVATSLTVAKRKPGKAAVKVRVNASRTPQGKLSMRIAGRTAKANVRSGRLVSLKLPKGVRKGSHKAVITFTPSNPKLHKPSSKRITVKVR